MLCGYGRVRVEGRALSNPQDSCNRQTDSSFENLAYLPTVLLKIPATGSYTGLVMLRFMFCVDAEAADSALPQCIPHF